MSQRRLWAVARKEWVHIRRDPRSLAVAMAVPVVLLLLMGAGVNFDLTELPFAVCDFDGSPTSRMLASELSHLDLFRLAAAARDTAEGERLLRERKCLFVLTIPPSMEADLARGRPVALQVLIDGSDSNTASIARNYLEGALARFSSDLVLEAGLRRGLPTSVVRSPITISRKVLYNPAMESRQFIVPGLIVIILVILGGILTSGAVVRERERGTFETLAASPVLAVEILLGKLIPYLVLGWVDVLTAIGTGAVVFGVRVAGSVELLLGCAVVFLLCALGLGLFISTISRTQQTAMMGAIVATLLPAMILSGFAFPIRNMPLLLRMIAHVIPPTHFLVLARGIYLKGVGLGVLWPPLAALVGFAVIIFGLSIRGFRKQLS
jgi:drug efflux transport system permease protein